jgi:hypothetical protein
MGAGEPHERNTNTLVFKYPRLALFSISGAVAAIFLSGGFSMVFDGIRDGSFRSPKGLLVLVLAVAGNLCVLSIILKLWQTDWRFAFSASHFMAERPLGKKRVVIPWEAIVRVNKIRSSWWSLGSVSQIETSCGHKILFGTHMLGYDRFVGELRIRAVNCIDFDPYDPKLVDHW